MVCVCVCLCMYAYSQVIGHWSSPAPELKLLPAKLIPTVEKIVEKSLLTPEHTSLISQHSQGLFNLFRHDIQRLGTQHASSEKVSTRLVQLLTVMLSKAKAGLVAKTTVVTEPWMCDMPPFENMLRTASYGPSHPVFRRLPFFKYDYYNKQQVARYAKNRQAELEGMQSELSKQSVRMGATCNKYKTKKTSLTSGVFTIFCNRCGIIEYFELMCQPESPATPARALLHRVWRESDATSQAEWLASNKTRFCDSVKCV